MIRLKGSPLTASRQLIAHLKASGRWPEENGGPQRSHGRDSSNLPSNETKSDEEGGVHQANDEVRQEGRRNWRILFFGVAIASRYSAISREGSASWTISASVGRTFEVKATTENFKPSCCSFQCVIAAPSKGPCQTCFSSKRLPSSSTKAPPRKLPKKHIM